jgi:hypothetical protein
MAMQVLCAGIALATALVLALELLIWLRLTIPLSLLGFGCVFYVVSWCVGHCGCCHLIPSYKINMYGAFGEGQSISRKSADWPGTVIQRLLPWPRDKRSQIWKTYTSEAVSNGVAIHGVADEV